MTRFFLAGLAAAALSWHPTQAQTGEAPRQLGTLPSVPKVVPPRPPAPVQLGGGPVVKRAPADAPTDSARRQAAAPGYGTGRVSGAAGPLSATASLPSSGYQVGLKTGEILRVTEVAPKNPLFGREYLLLNGQQRVELDNVRFYEDASGRYLRAPLPGGSRETTLHVDKAGRLSLYSITTSQYSGGGFGMGGVPYGGGFQTVRNEYFSKENGPIQALTYRNLVLATADSPGAQKLLAQARRYRLFSTLSYVAGGGLLVAGLFQTGRPSGNMEKRSFSPVVFASVPFLLVPLVLRGRQAAAQQQAISVYNARQ